MNGSSSSPSPLHEVMAMRRLPLLDGLRGVAVMAVMITHFLDRTGGDLAVTLFFVLSALLITWMFLNEHERTGTVSIGAFLTRRVLRLVPAYFVYLLLMIALALWRDTLFISWPLVVSAFTFSVNYYAAFTGAPSTFISQGWSLAQEQQFYLLWPGVFLFAMSRSPRFLIRLLGGVILAVLVWRSGLYLSGLAGEPYVYHAFDTRMDALAIGCLLGTSARAGWCARVIPWMWRYAWLPLVTLALALALRLLVADAVHYSIGFGLEAALMAFLLLQLLPWHRHALWRWLEHPVSRYVGNISFGLYLYHGVGQSMLTRAAFLPGPLPLLLAVLSSLVLAAGSYHLIERPFLDLKRRVTGVSMRSSGASAAMRETA